MIKKILKFTKKIIFIHKLKVGIYILNLLLFNLKNEALMSNITPRDLILFIKKLLGSLDSLYVLQLL